VGGSLGGIKSSAKGSFGLTGDYHYGSNDEVYVAQASVVNGADYVVPPKDGSIQLTPEAAKLRKANSEAFRQLCGDGFVASIVSGADLYRLFHFHDVTETDKVSISASFSGSSGIGDLFKASSHSKISTTIQNFYDKNQLDLQFVQKGGHIGLLPVDLATAKTKVQGLPKEALDGPRPIFIVVVPYTDLPGVVAGKIFSELDIKQKANRYLERLGSVYSEITRIEGDYFRDRFVLAPDNGGAPKPSADQYLYWYAHQIRVEDLSAIHDDVLSEIKMMTTVVRDLDDPRCGDSNYATSEQCEALTPSKNIVGIACELLPASEPTCQKLIDRINSAHHFDDYVFWIRLPLPVNSMPADVFYRLGRAGLDDQRLYAHYLFRHWIQRFDELRCGMFFDCLTDAERAGYLKAILSSFSPGPPAILVNSTDLPSNLQQGVRVAPGFSVKITESRVDSLPVKHSIYYHDLSLADGWVLLAKDIYFGYETTIEGSDKGFEIGVFGELCSPGIPAPTCHVGTYYPTQPGSLNYELGYYDIGESQASAWDLKIKVEATPIPPFELTPQ
jgi:hypothetical protein